MSQLTFANVTITFFSVTLGTVIAQTKLTSQAKVTVNSIGPVKIGMNLPEAAAAADTRFF